MPDLNLSPPLYLSHDGSVAGPYHWARLARCDESGRQAVPAEDSDWATEAGRRQLQPCHPHGALPWLAVTADTPMCVTPPGDGDQQFWQDAYDDAYY